MNRKQTQYELSLVKRFDRIQLKTPAQGILSQVKPPYKFGLTPIIEDLAELKLSSKKKAIKDDFEIQLQTPRLIDEQELRVETISAKQAYGELNVTKQLAGQFNEGNNLEN